MERNQTLTVKINREKGHATFTLETDGYSTPYTVWVDVCDDGQYRVNDTSDADQTTHETFGDALRIAMTDMADTLEAEA